MTNKYAGYLYCADCHSRMYINRCHSLSDSQISYSCGTYQTKGKNHCTYHYIRRILLDGIVLNRIREMTGFARDNPEAFYALAMEKAEKETKKLLKLSAGEITIVQKRIRELDNIIRCLYEDRVTGRITPDRFDALAAGYEQEQSEQKERLDGLEKTVSEQDLKEKKVAEFIENASRYVDIKEITPEILHAFVRRIEYHEREVPHKQKLGYKLDIYYAFETEETSI